MVTCTEVVEKQLRHAASTGRALILKNSHVGGHKYAGNTIVRLFTPLTPRLYIYSQPESEPESN